MSICINNAIYALKTKKCELFSGNKEGTCISLL